MATKLPYEMVEVRVWELTRTMMGKSVEDQILILDQIDEWLNACGWENWEFEKETLNRISRQWDNNQLN